MSFVNAAREKGDGAATTPSGIHIVTLNHRTVSAWLADWAPECLSVVRVVTGLLFLEYGLSDPKRPF
jgi:hypothetical protein